MIDSQDRRFAEALQSGILPANEQQRTLFEAEGLIPCVVGKGSFRELAYGAIAFEIARARCVQSVLAALVQIQVPFLVLKGGALAYLVYDEPWHRSRNDTDILIAAADQQRVFSMLKKLGFEAHTMLPGSSVMAEASFTLIDDVGLEHTFDVHWRINNNWRLSALTSINELMIERIPVPQMPQGTFTCSPRWAILISAMHRAAHFNYPAYELEGFKRREADFTLWIYDVDRLSRGLSENDWDWMVAIACQRGFAELLGDMLQRSISLFDTPVPEHVVTALMTARQQLSVDAFDTRFGAAWQSFSAVPGLIGKVTYLWQQFIPSRDYMKDRFGKGFLPFQYCSRLLNGLFQRVD